LSYSIDHIPIARDKLNTPNIGAKLKRMEEGTFTSQVAKQSYVFEVRQLPGFFLKKKEARSSSLLQINNILEM